MPPARIEIGSIRDRELFWENVAPPDDNGCRIWLLGTNGHGYGSVKRSDKRIAAHRHAYFLIHGDIPFGESVLHSCDNPPYCEPSHLFLGTQLDNMRDMVAKGRGNVPVFHGEDHPRAKLTEREVREIRSLQGSLTQVVIAERFGITQSRVSEILLRKRWASV